MGSLIGGGVATLLTVMILSRVVGDNPLYRIAQYLLVGVALGSIAAVLVNQALVPPTRQAVAGTAPLTTLVTLGVSAALVLLLLARFGRQRASYLANVPLALLFGVGAALALVGAARGTLVPQLLDTIAVRRLATVDPIQVSGTIVLIATVCITLLAFTYTQRGAQPSAWTRGVRGLGRGLVLATFGVFLAAAVTTYITALVFQLQFIADWVTEVINYFS